MSKKLLTKTELQLLYLAAMSIVFPELGMQERFEESGVEGLKKILLKLDDLLEYMEKREN